MSGWIVFVGQNDNFRDRVEHFKKIFNVENVTPLKIEITELSPDFKLLLWAWSNIKFPDVYFHKSKNEDALVLNGYITSTGAMCDFNSDQDLTSQKIFNKWLDSKKFSIEQLNGSFSSLFYDAQRNESTVYTDRFASRSVWMSRERNTWIIGNFPAAIRACMRDTIKIDPAGLWSLLATSRHVGSQGIFQDIHNMQAGQKTVLRSNGTFTISDWYMRRYKPEFNKSPKQWGGVIAETLKSSAETLKKVTSNPYLFLSGGLDSRLVAGAYGKDLSNLTLTTHPNYNSKISERVAAHLGQHHQTIIRAPYWYLDTFNAAGLMASGNYNISHAHFIMPVMETLESDRNAAFMLGDLLENFNKHYFKAIEIKPNKITHRDIPDHFHKLFSFTHKDPQSLLKLFNNDFGSRAYEAWREALIGNYVRIESVSEQVEDRLDTLFRWDNCSICPTYLMLESMIPFAPIRNLMFNNDMLDLLLRIPAEIRGTRKLHKWTLWHLNKKLSLIPDSNFWLPPMFPTTMFNLTRKIRPLIGKSRRRLLSLYKKGPIVKTEGSWHMNHVWYRNDSQYISFIRNQLLNKSSLMNVLDHENVKNKWSEFYNGDVSKLFEIEMMLSFSLLK